jgi:hypothetical protein
MTWRVRQKRENVEVITAFNNLEETMSIGEKDEEIDKIFFGYFDYVLVLFRFRKSRVWCRHITEKSKLKAAQRGSQRGSYGCSISGGGPITPHRSSASYWLPLTHQPPFSSERIYQVEIFSPAFSCVFCHLFLVARPPCMGCCLALFGPFFG